jgi:hypothetical protein
MQSEHGAPAVIVFQNKSSAKAMRRLRDPSKLNIRL